jgi:hypothetical protein
MLNFVLGSIGFVLGIFLFTDLIDKILWWRANPLSLPNVLAKPEFPTKAAAVKYWLRHRQYGLMWIENYAQEIVGWFALLTILILLVILRLDWTRGIEPQPGRREGAATKPYGSRKHAPVANQAFGSRGRFPIPRPAPPGALSSPPTTKGRRGEPGYRSRGLIHAPLMPVM